MAPEKKVELGSALGSKLGTMVRRKDIEGKATAGWDHSAKAAVSTGQYRG